MRDDFWNAWLCILVTVTLVSVILPIEFTGNTSGSIEPNVQSDIESESMVVMNAWDGNIFAVSFSNTT